MFKEILTENRIYRNEDGKNWGIIDTTVTNYANKLGLKQIGVGLLKQFAKKGQASEMTFYDLLSNEKYKTKEVDLKSGERLCRYMTEKSVVNGEFPICILNADKGYMKFLENIDKDPEPEDYKWSKPFKFEYLRVNY
jgi:hypothetical protein